MLNDPKEEHIEGVFSQDTRNTAMVIICECQERGFYTWVFLLILTLPLTFTVPSYHFANSHCSLPSFSFIL